MGTVLALSSPEFPVRTLGSTGTVLAHSRSTAAVSETAWLTATIRPAGTFGRNDTSRLRALLAALAACASSSARNRLVSLRPKVPAGRIVAVSHAVSDTAAAGPVRARTVPQVAHRAGDDSRDCGRPRRSAWRRSR